jgi:hypothetical protein
MLSVYIEMLNVVLERPAFCAVCIHRNVKFSFWGDLRLVLFGVLHIVKGSYWRDLRYVLFVYIVILNVTFGETSVWCCFCTSYF